MRHLRTSSSSSSSWDRVDGRGPLHQPSVTTTASLHRSSARWRVYRHRSAAFMSDADGPRVRRRLELEEKPVRTTAACVNTRDGNKIEPNRTHQTKIHILERSKSNWKWCAKNVYNSNRTEPNRILLSGFLPDRQIRRLANIYN